MSITFNSDASGTVTEKAEPCLCAQLCDAWGSFYHGEDTPEIRAELKASAHSACPSCKGTGVETVKESDAPTLNFCNDNALRILGALGLDVDYCGSATIAEARRAVMRGRARGDLSGHVREAEVHRGAPYTREDGVVELGQARFFSSGLDEDGIRSRIERFSAFVMEAEGRGATKIWWG